MNNTQLLEKIVTILESMNNSNSSVIAIGTLIVAVLALFVSVAAIYIPHKQYIDSIAPALSFELYEHSGCLFLAVKNTGLTKATEIDLKFLALKDNGDKTAIDERNVFQKQFVLYPGEKIEGEIAGSGRNMGTHTIPIVELDISYIKGNNNRKEAYRRTVHFTERISSEPQIIPEMYAKSIDDSLKAIKYANNRLANYIEGRTLFTFDEINAFPPSSLYKDMRAAFNNEERCTEKTKGRSEEDGLLRELEV